MGNASRPSAHIDNDPRFDEYMAKKRTQVRATTYEQRLKKLRGELHEALEGDMGVIEPDSLALLPVCINATYFGLLSFNSQGGCTGDEIEHYPWGFVRIRQKPYIAFYVLNRDYSKLRDAFLAAGLDVDDDTLVWVTEELLASTWLNAKYFTRWRGATNVRAFPDRQTAEENIAVDNEIECTAALVHWMQRHMSMLTVYDRHWGADTREFGRRVMEAIESAVPQYVK